MPQSFKKNQCLRVVGELNEKEHIPMPTPMMNLPMSSVKTCCEAASVMPPTTNTKDANIMVFLRPMRSLDIPEMSEKNMAAPIVILTNICFFSDVIGSTL